MLNPTEKDERQYLDSIKEKLQDALKRIDDRVRQYAGELRDQKEYLYENKTGMDHAEKVSVRQSITQMAMTGETAVVRKKRLRKLLDSPYFGRIDFSEEGKGERQPFYIGIHSFYDEADSANFVHDWRAPLSGMFYDFELGKANYEAPSGNVSGEIFLKRQYRIRNGRMEFMLENAVNIVDDILQQELSKASDDRMKNIVATIQRDQNAIVRNETASALIIQGVAGSGKTSIALHRIAFLLYRFKETIASKDILIISPNKVYADYISNVLPELGEEKIPEKGMEELAAEALEHKYKFQTFFEQVAMLLENKDEAFRERMRFKASPDFLGLLNEYIAYIEKEYFAPADIRLGRCLVPAWFIEERFRAYHRLPLMNRFPLIAKDIDENIKVYYNQELTAAERNDMRKQVEKMFRITNLRELYKDFFDWLGKPELFKPASRSILEYADVFPLIYLKMRLEGIAAYDKVKHLLVDEMQDYAPVQYAVLQGLFACKKTILGDAHQSVNPYSSSTAESIRKVFPNADFVNLRKSYRSTLEIARFAQRIAGSDDLEVVERHGETPVVKGFTHEDEEMEAIFNFIDDFQKSGHQSLGVICKTQKQAERLHDRLKEKVPQIYLLDAQSASFSKGVILTTAHMAKGLEFDCVTAPFASAENYHTEMDKRLLYIACTRAMHILHITYCGQRTQFIKLTN